MVTEEQKRHWASELWMLRAILVAIIGGGAATFIWVGEIETRLGMVEKEQERAVAEMRIVVDRQRQIENTAARVDQRLVSIERSTERIERMVEGLTDPRSHPRAE